MRRTTSARAGLSRRTRKAHAAMRLRLQRVIVDGHRRVQHEATPVSSCLTRVRFLLTWTMLLWFASRQVFEFKGVCHAKMVSSGDIRSDCLGIADLNSFCS